MIPKEMIEAAAKAIDPDDWNLYLERARAILAAALSFQWRPIESAPRDGTQILVLAEEQGAYSWYVVSYEVLGDRGSIYFPWETEDGVSYHHDVPKWWMPLPPPPLFHKSDCTTNNGPAKTPGPCDCGAKEGEA